MQKDSDIINGIPIVKTWQYHWLWLPTLYLMRGLPYVVMFMTSVVFFYQLGIDNNEIIFSTTWLFLPLIFRPILSRVLLSFESKRYWILLCEFIIGLCFIGIALSIPNIYSYNLSLTFFFIIALSASLHDIAIERFYKRNANNRRRSAFMGVRTIAYLSAIILGFTAPLMLVGYLEITLRLIKTPWITIFYCLGGICLFLCLYHSIMMPKAFIRAQLPFNIKITQIWLKDVWQTITTRHSYLYQLLFLSLFLLPEMIFMRIITSFLFDTGSGGGLGFSPQEIGFIQGVIGFVGFTLGAIIGFLAVRKYGIFALRWTMVWLLVLPKLFFIYLSFSFSSSLSLVSFFVLLDHICAGYSFIMYTLYLLYLTHGKHPTFSYSVGVSITGVSFFISGMLTGKLIEHFSYQHIFIFISLLGTISLFCVKKLPISSSLDSMFKQFTKSRKIDVFSKEK